MKRNLFVCLLATLSLVACNGGEATTTSTNTAGTEVTVPTTTGTTTTDPSETLDKVTNLQYSDGKITFNAVANATSYRLSIKQNEIVVHEKDYATTTIDITPLGLYGGHYTASVIAKNGGIKSEAEFVNFETLHKDTTLRLEAELACLDRTRNWSDDAEASNYAYALAFDDCGQGMYFRYYAFEAGNREVKVAYATAMPGSKMTLFVNNSNVSNTYSVVFSENTGWFGDSHEFAEVIVENVTLVQGWNELYLMKNGTSSDDPQWGGYAQIDYIEISGTNHEFDLDDFDMSSNIYNLEAEMAHWHWDDSSQRPTNWGGSFSLGFGIGEMNHADDGVRFDVTIAEAGTYAICPKLSGNKSLKVKIDDGEEVTPDAFGAYSNWDNPETASDDIYRVELSAGFHQIDFIRNGNWFCFDKLVLLKVTE